MISGLFVPHHEKFLGIFLIGSPLGESKNKFPLHITWCKFEFALHNVIRASLFP
jgi:hypothetical protein